MIFVYLSALKYSRLNSSDQGWQSVGSIRFPDTVPTEISRSRSCSDLEIHSKRRIRIVSSVYLLKYRSYHSVLQVLPGKSRSDCRLWSGFPTFNVKWDQAQNDRRAIISHFTSRATNTAGHCIK